MINNNHLIEGYDKAAFLRWLQVECFISQLEEGDVNGICQKWINHKIEEERAFLIEKLGDGLVARDR